MSQSARNNSHASSACVNCRNRKRKCSGSGPTCASCAEKNIQCEWTVENDGRRIGHSLQLENASLRAEVTELRALVNALRAGALEELSYYTTLQLPPYLDGDLAALALQTDVRQQHGANGTPFDGPLHDLLERANSGSRSSCPTLFGQTGVPAGPTIGSAAEDVSVHVNVFGPGAIPLFAGVVNLEARHM